MVERMTWADREGIATGVMGEIHKGVPINEENRASVWEFRKEGVESLRELLRKSYIKKGIRAVLFGVHNGPDTIKYAIFVQSGFLKLVGDDD